MDSGSSTLEGTVTATNHDVFATKGHPLTTSATPVNTIWNLLLDASKSEGHIAIHESNRDGAATEIGYSNLMRGSEEKALLIQEISDLTTGSVILIHFDNHRQNFEWLWAVIRAGFIPAMSTPFSSDASQRQNHISHLKILLKNPLLLTTTTTLDRYPEANTIRHQGIESIPKPSRRGANVRPAPDTSPVPPDLDSAILVLTSGSTGNAKAVSLTVPQILSSIRGKSEAFGTTSSSVFLNWIGMDHVANLTEMHLHAMSLGAKQIHVQANDLLAEPLLFLRLLAKYQVTHTFAPNFFLALLEKELSRCPKSDPIWSIELGALKTIVSGGEANVIQTAGSLNMLLSEMGVRNQIIRAGYGLTESCAGLTYASLDLDYEEREGHEFASLGHPITGAMVRITTDDGQIASVGEVGNLELSGPVIFKKYYNDPNATQKAFTKDGWYITGDRAYIDLYQKLNLTGRVKEVINVNGVKFFPIDIETAIERTSFPSVIPSFTAAFSYRPAGSSTESYCLVYGSNEQGDSTRTVDAIAKLCSGLLGSRPMWIIPLPIGLLDKSTLGKLSRSKIKEQFEKGVYDDRKIEVASAMRAVALKDKVVPETETQARIVKVLSEMLNIPLDEISINRSVFELGVTSVGLFRFERELRRQIKGPTISAIAFLNNPIIQHIAEAFDDRSSREYDPVVQLQAHGRKTPLWLVHPASGNVLAFLPLARTVTDRPLFALTARGLSNQETLFSSIAEMADTYFKRLKLVQPVGPYAITGYSLGTTVAFEIAKRLEENGDHVAFCAALDSPPHVVPLVKDLDWTDAAVLVSYFLGLIFQDDVSPLSQRFRGLSRIDVVKGILDVSRSEQRATLRLDPEQLLAIANVTDNFGSMAKKYHPEGQVDKVDIFFCTPLRSVEQDRHAWIRDHLSKWQSFSRTPVEYHECEGEHAEMLNPEHVFGFEERLNKALQLRGL
ncbi:MAG: hypothetical protein Q9165_003617 [Trypethelium subeluteriae]